MNAVDFLARFHSGGPWVLTAIPPDRKGTETRTFTEPERAATWIAENNGKRNLYFTVNRVARPLTKKAQKEDITAATYLHVDIDARAREDLPTEFARIKKLLTEFVPAPTFIIFSGGGYQAFWKLKEPVTEPPTKVEAYNKQLAQVLGGDHCWNVDRIMRLPDTTNIPDEKKVAKGRVRVQAEVFDYDLARTYELSRFVAAPTEEKVRDGEQLRPVGAANGPLDTVDDLDKWEVPERVKIIVAQGHDPDNPKERDNSRSVWLFDAVCQLVRHDVPDEVILSVITDPKFAISASVIERRDAGAYARRQVEEAKKKVANDPPVVSKFTPLLTAHKFVLRRRPTLLRSNDDYLAYNGVAYAELEDETIKSEMYDFLHGATTGDPPLPFCPTKPKVANVIDALEGVTHRPRDMFSPPCWLDGVGPPPLEIVACQNGLLHLPTGELHAPTWRFFTRNALEFEHDQRAPQPTRWFAFLDEIWPGDEHDVIGTLQEIFGYLLVPDTAQQKVFMLVGPPRSGKGTVARVLTQLVGKHNTCAPTLKGIGETFGLEPLIGKQLALVSDLRLGAKTDHASIAENLLRISGEDMVTANRKYKRAWEGKLSVRFLVMTNEMPRFADASGALANRFVPLVMRRSFLGREDPGLLGKLLPERPGILNWAIDGWRRLSERGHFELPESSQEAVQHLADLASPEAAFIRDECELDPDAVTPKVDVHAAFKVWCARSGDMPPGTLEVFSSRLLAAANGRVDTTKVRVGERRVPSYRGIRLRAQVF